MSSFPSSEKVLAFTVRRVFKRVNSHTGSVFNLSFLFAKGRNQQLIKTDVLNGFLVDYYSARHQLDCTVKAFFDSR